MNHMLSKRYLYLIMMLIVLHLLQKMLLKVPIVASEVDTVASELIRTFVDQDNLFGVLSDRGNPEAAMAFQSLLGRDARQQQWGRHIALFCSNAARYNVAAIEADKIWQRIISLPMMRLQLMPPLSLSLLQ